MLTQIGLGIGSMTIHSTRIHCLFPNLCPVPENGTYFFSASCSCFCCWNCSARFFLNSSSSDEEGGTTVLYSSFPVALTTNFCSGGGDTGNVDDDVDVDAVDADDADTDDDDADDDDADDDDADDADGF